MSRVLEPVGSSAGAEAGAALNTVKLNTVGSGAGAEAGAALGVAGDEHSGHTVVRIVT